MAVGKTVATVRVDFRNSNRQSLPTGNPENVQIAEQPVSRKIHRLLKFQLR